jgi:hypothetical protein
MNEANGIVNSIPDEHQTIFFVHVPRTAGTSLRNMLVDARLRINPEAWDISDRREVPDVGWQFTRHLAKMRRSTVGLVMGHMPYGFGTLFQNPLYITVLRDPVERLISSYNYFMLEQGKFRGEASAVTVSDIESFSWHPAFTNHQLQYFLDFDVENSTAFMTLIGKGRAPGWLGVSFGERQRVELRNIRLLQRRLGPAEFKVQCSNDEFRTHVVDIASYCIQSEMNRHIDIAIPPNVGGTSWRIVPQTDAELMNWYVISMELWEETDGGGLKLAAGGIYEPDPGTPRGAKRITRAWPEAARALSSGHFDDLVPEHAFDGKNAPSLLDLDGTALRSEHLRIAKRNLAKFAAVGLVEDMPAFHRLLAAKTGYADLQLRHDNASTKLVALQNIDPKVVETIRSLNRLDVEFYEFGRDLSRSQMQSEAIAQNEVAQEL